MVEFYEEQQRLKDERITPTQEDWGKQLNRRCYLGLLG
jgi:hypothetical protein